MPTKTLTIRFWLLGPKPWRDKDKDSMTADNGISGKADKDLEGKEEVLLDKALMKL